MNKRGDAYATATLIEYAILIFIIITFSVAIYKAPHEERVNKLKAVDLELTLESVSSTKEDVLLNYDLGEGMSVGIKNKEIKIYQKNKAKAAQGTLTKDFSFLDLSEEKYTSLSIIKEGNVMKVEG